MSVGEDFADERLSTGVSGLDVLLDGGLIKGGVYLVMGRPGTGKTTLCNQLCFVQAQAGARAVYVTLLAETHSRMLRNLQSFSFFHAELIGSSVLYLGGYLVLRERRLSGLMNMVRQVLNDEQPTLLVIDGLKSAQTLGEADISLKEFVAELQVVADMSGCTTLLAANMISEDATASEHSMVDGLIELSLKRTEQRTFRELEVLKFRGANHFLGCHDLEIATSGIIVRPRTELLLAKQVRPACRSSGQRVDTGVPNLDDMLGGGLLSGSTTMLLGFAGSGKTMLALHFLEAGAKKGEPCLYFGFYESPLRLLESAASVSLSLEQRIENKHLHIVWQPPLKYGLDCLAERLLSLVDMHGIRRVVIDGLDGIRQSATYPERSIRFVTALVNELRARDVTLLITEETQKLFGPEVEVRIEGMSALVENILLLEYVDMGGELKRLFSIVKQRSSGFDTSIRELCITDQGITLATDGHSAREIMLGFDKHKPRAQKRALRRHSSTLRGGARGRSR